MNKKYFWLVIAIAWVFIGLVVYFGPSNSTESTPSSGHREAAEQGDAAAQYELGNIDGLGIQPEEALAAKLIRTAAEQGDVDAQNTLGFMYAEGRCVLMDMKEAVKWVRKAAEQGYAPAQFNLGVMYTEGKGVPEDYVQAVKWLRKSAAQGNTEARNVLKANGLRWD